MEEIVKLVSNATNKSASIIRLGLKRHKFITWDVLDLPAVIYENDEFQRDNGAKELRKFGGIAIPVDGTDAMRTQLHQIVLPIGWEFLAVPDVPYAFIKENEKIRGHLDRAQDLGSEDLFDTSAPLRMFQITLLPRFFTCIRRDEEKMLRCYVHDRARNAERIWTSSPEVPAISQAPSAMWCATVKVLEQSQRLSEYAKEWLNTNYPKWEDLHAYWDEK